MLTISELAAYAGVSVRTVRHYHQIGVLPEPPRDEYDHRRYDADDLLALRRVCTLADAGVPLKQIPGVLAAPDDERDRMLDEIDADLRRRQRELRETRTRLGHLRDDPTLVPPKVQAHLDRLRAIGVPEVWVDHERQDWLLTHMLYPDLTDAWLDMQEVLIGDPEYAAQYLRIIEAMSWDADDPRILELARKNVELAHRHQQSYEAWMADWSANPRAAELLKQHSSRMYDSPAFDTLQREVLRLMQAESC